MSEPNKKIIRKTFPVLNMSCAACASAAQKILSRQEGVNEVTVNYASEMADIKYYPHLTNPDKLRAALEQAGYGLLIEEDEDIELKIEESHTEKISLLKKKSIVALVFSFPLLIIGMVPALMHITYANYIMWLLATPVVFYSGRQFFLGAYKQAKHRSANMDTLVSLSAGVAYLYSAFNTLFPFVWENKGLEVHVYFEAAAVIITFVLLGKLLEEKARGNTSSSLKKLIGLQPKTVLVLTKDGEKEIPVENILVGDTVLVKPGEKIAVDGVVTDGNSYVDESMISGEPVPVIKKAGDKVFAGTINQKASFRFQAEKVGKDTLLSHIIQMVKEAQGSKPPIQKLVDKIAGIFVPVVILIAVLTFILWLLFGGANGFTYGLLSMITVLVIACPCALGLATPTAIMVGIGKGAENGILIKDAESLEMTRKINAIVFDKTGTLTEGKPSVTDMYWVEKVNDNFNSILYNMERASEHPLAEAICSYIPEKSAYLPEIRVQSISGFGIIATYQDKKYFAGNKQLAQQYNITVEPGIRNWIDVRLKEANTIVFFGREDKLICLLAIKDQVKDSSREAVKQLKKSGIETYMLTGDNVHAAHAVAFATGIQYYQAGLLPAGKTDFVKGLQKDGKIVAMVGDGINDSIALAQADVSIAMGKGTDIAMDVAKMTIVSGDLMKIPQALHLSVQTVRTIRQNLFWAFIYNLIGIPIAAGILYPLNGFLLNPMIAGAAMALSSVSVVSNSLRLRFSNLNKE